jgi:hypothetical protein
MGQRLAGNNEMIQDTQVIRIPQRQDMTRKLLAVDIHKLISLGFDHVSILCQDIGLMGEASSRILP